MRHENKQSFRANFHESYQFANHLPRFMKLQNRQSLAGYVLLTVLSSNVLNSLYVYSSY